MISNLYYESEESQSEKETTSSNSSNLLSFFSSFISIKIKTISNSSNLQFNVQPDSNSIQIIRRCLYSIDCSIHVK